MTTQTVQTIASRRRGSSSWHVEVPCFRDPPSSPFSQDSSPPHFIHGEYTLCVSTSFSTGYTPTPSPRRASLTVCISVDARLPDLQLNDPRSPETQQEAFYLARDIPSYTSIRRHIFLAERLDRQIRGAFDIPESCILMLTLPEKDNVPISMLDVISSLVMDLRRFPHAPWPRRARLLGADTNRIVAHVHVLSPLTVPQLNQAPREITYSAHVSLQGKTLVIQLRQPEILVAELVGKVSELLGVGGKVGGKVVLFWAGKELAGALTISENMFVKDMVSRVEGKEGRMVQLTATLEGMGGVGEAGGNSKR